LLELLLHRFELRLRGIVGTRGAANGARRDDQRR